MQTRVKIYEQKLGLIRIIHRLFGSPACVGDFSRTQARKGYAAAGQDIRCEKHTNTGANRPQLLDGDIIVGGVMFASTLD